jgi:hypothetical protein
MKDFDWKPFPGEYEKLWYDIKLNDGTVYENCYPNAGRFHYYYREVKEFRVRETEMNKFWLEKLKRCKETSTYEYTE